MLAVFLREAKRPDPNAIRSDELSEFGSEQHDSPPQISATVPESPEFAREPKELSLELERMARATSQAARIDVDRVIKDNPDVKVLQGYRGASKVKLTPERYYELQQQFYSLPQVQADLGLHEGGYIHYGFRPEDLLAKGALFKKGVLPNNLNNPIHEIFRIDHWTNTEDSIYKVLEPALRLASMYLQQPLAFQWWVTRMFAERSLDMAESKIQGRLIQRLKDQVPLTRKNTSIAMEYLKHLGSHVVPDEGHCFNFRFAEKERFQLVDPDCGECHGCTYLILAFGTKNKNTISPWIDYRHVDARFPKGKYNRVEVLIHSDYYIAARKFRDTKFLDINQYLRFNFLIAATLVHEVSHCLDIIDSYHGREEPHFFSDPCMGTGNIGESGFAWERSTFGGRIDTTNSDRSGRYGIVISDWPNPVHPSEVRFYAINMDYIERIQRQEIWDQTLSLPVDDDISRCLYVSRHDCAVGYMHPNVMPMRFEEFEKERLSNIADAKKAEEARLERLADEEYKRTYADLDQMEDAKKAQKARDKALAQEAEALLEKERERRDRLMQRLEDEARANYKAHFGYDDPLSFERLKKQQPKRPPARLPPRRHNTDRRSASPEAPPPVIPDVENETTREIRQIRKDRDRRAARAADDKRQSFRGMEWEVERDKERDQERDRIRDQERNRIRERKREEEKARRKLFDNEEEMQDVPTQSEEKEEGRL
ncbi:hypothetical protein MMC11_003034 [Xylographa trunciseda]|nr:hypothetical protein [Xylographa trunciseda]